MELLEKLILGEKITDRDIEYALFEECNQYHSSDCDSGMCLLSSVYERKEGEGCPFFKDGKKMLRFLRENLPKRPKLY